MNQTAAHSPLSQTIQANQTAEPGEYNLVEQWLRFRPRRWLAGAFSGIFAGSMMLVVAMLMAKAFGYDVWYPAKIAAIPFLGGAAMDFGNVQGVVVGLVMHLALCAVLGTFYSHFSIFSAPLPLLGAGFVWGFFSWVFISCLFSQSFTEVFALQFNQGASFFCHLTFGFSLASLTFFEKVFE